MWSNIKLQYSILLLLICFVILISVDLITGIYFWNRENLFFNSTKFNEIFTPVVALLSTIIYAWALQFTIRQNKLVLSQSIKPFYEKEFSKLVDKGKSMSLENLGLFSNDTNAFNYIERMTKTLLNLTQNYDFQKDYENFKKDETFEKEHFLKSTYSKELLYLYTLTMFEFTEVGFLYKDLIEFIKEINNSKLINEDKQLFILQIKRTFLIEYFTIIEQMEKRIIFPPIPIRYDITNNRKIEFKLLIETDFKKLYCELKELTK